LALPRRRSTAHADGQRGGRPHWSGCVNGKGDRETSAPRRSLAGHEPAGGDKRWMILPLAAYAGGRARLAPTLSRTRQYSMSRDNTAPNRKARIIALSATVLALVGGLSLSNKANADCWRRGERCPAPSRYRQAEEINQASGSASAGQRVRPEPVGAASTGHAKPDEEHDPPDQRNQHDQQPPT
jgi:hypothetical protein